MSKLFKEKKEKIYKKGEVIVEQNSICRYLYYIIKGSTRTFHINENGDDSTHWFAFEEQFVTLFNSFTNKIPSLYGLEALEDLKVLRINKYDLDKYISESAENFQLYNNYVVSATKKISDRLISLQHDSAKVRYERLIKDEPKVFQRASLGQIASYLGITQQSLSRIRSV
jgi:CRP-like cAMP-binding protein